MCRASGLTLPQQDATVSSHTGGGRRMAHEQASKDKYPRSGSALDPGEFVTTRLVPSDQNSKLLEREQLLDVLANARARLVLLEAPAGYGKTTLLGQWRDRLMREGARVAWLTQDRGDAGISESLRFIEHALRAVGVGADAKTDVAHLEVEPGTQIGDTQTRVRATLNAIAATTQRVVLILDELEHAPAGLGEEVIEPLLRRAPSNLQIVLASRVRLTLRVAALRAQGLVIRLGAAELCCSSAEIAQIFDCKLSRRELATVVNATRGWPAAVQVLRGAWSRGAALRPDNCCTLPDIVDYVTEEVLGALPPEQRQLLREIAVLDRLRAEAVHAVTARSGAWRELLASERLHAFLMPDQDPDARLLHPILRAVCAAEFAAAGPARCADVLRAAARWYVGQGQLVRAVSLALQCGDHELAGILILDAGGVHLWIHQGKAVTKGVDALLTEPLLDRFPRIRLLRSLVQIKDGQLRAGRRSFEQVRDATAGFTKLPADSDVALLRRDSLVVETTLLMNECQPTSDAYLESYERAMRGVAGEDHLLKAQVRNLFCLACVQRGLFDKAASAAHAAIDEYRRGGSTHGQLFEHLHLGGIAFAQGMPAVAKAAYARSRELARRHFGDDQTKSALLNALGAELAYEQNLLGAALRLTRQAAPHIPHTELWHDIYAAQFVTSALLALDRNGISEALAVLDDARHEAAERNAGGVARLLDATRVSCLALAGVADEAHEVMQQRELDLAAYLASSEEKMWREQEAVLVAGIRVAARRPAVPVPVAQVEEVLGKLWSGKQVRAAIRLGSALAAFYWSRGRPAPALAHFDNALRASQRSGYVRAFIEDRDHIRPLLERWRSDVRDDAETSMVFHADALLVSIGNVVGVPAALTALTDREGEILQEISRGRSDKEIARTLRLSENTVKFHLKNLYAKLQVGRRIDAVQQARLRGMVH